MYGGGHKPEHMAMIIDCYAILPPNIQGKIALEVSACTYCCNDAFVAAWQLLW